MKLKSNYTKKELQKLSCNIAIYIIIILCTTLILADLYVIPVLDGMTDTINYLQSTNDNIFLAIANYDEKQMVDSFKNDFENNLESGMDAESSIIDTLNDVNNYQDDMLKQLYSIVLYMFSPLVSLYAICFFHAMFWFTVCRKISKLLKLNNTKKLRIWNDECRCY